MKAHRRIISIILSALVLFSAAALTASAEIRYIRGDADRNGEVESVDVTLILRKLIDMPVPTFDERAADVDGNGLEIYDATFIQRYLVGFSNPYQIGKTVVFDEYELPVV